jgi:ABC-2 type transport system permease protein
MNLNSIHIRSVIRKELREYRRNRFIIVTMAVMPVFFLALPIVNIFTLPASVSSAMLDRRLGLSLLYMLLIPAVVPAALASYSVVGEREQGTLEPLLTTPISREELLLGKAAAAMIPSVAVGYTAFGVFLACVRLFATSNVATAVFDQRSVLLAQAVFTPLLAGWAIWVGIAISSRSSDVRVAQQLGTLASIPPLAIVSLMSFRVIQPTLAVAVTFGVGLLAIDGLAWRVVSAMFDRERLITGAKPSANNTSSPTPKATDVSVTPMTPSNEKRATVSAALKLTREGVGIELRRGPFEIQLDGTRVGSIKRHETVETPLEPGRHTLRIRSGRYSSRDHSFDVNDGETVNFRTHGAMVWPRYVASIVKPDLAISLRRE